MYKALKMLVITVVMLFISSNAFATAYNVHIAGCGTQSATLEFSVDSSGWYHVLVTTDDDATGWYFVTTLSSKLIQVDSTINTFAVVTDLETGTSVNGYCD